MNKNYFVDISKQSNTNIPIIAGILENLNHEHKSLSVFIENNLKKISEKIQEIDAKIEFLEDIRKNFLKFNEIIEFTRDEKALYGLRCKMARGINPMNEYSNEKGTLLISNLYIYFIRENGLLKKRVEFIFKIPHEEFKRIEITGKVRKRLYMEFVYGKYFFAINSSKRNSVIDYIENARVFDENQKYDFESGKSLMLIKLDIKDLIDLIETNISYLLNLKCNQNLNYLPGYQVNYEDNYNRPQQSHYPQQTYPQPSRNLQNQNNFNYNENNVLMRNLGDYQGSSNSQYPPNLPPNTYQNQNPASFRPNHFQRNNYNANLDSRNSINPNELNYQFLNQRLEYSNRPEYRESKKNVYFNNRSRLLELEKEEFSLNQTLKLLDKKFQKSEISDVDYFRTYRTYQQELYVIQRKIQDIKQEITEEEALQKFSTEF